MTWVAQEARGVIMSGYTGPNHEKLRKALDQLDKAYNAPEE